MQAGPAHGCLQVLAILQYYHWHVPRPSTPTHCLASTRKKHLRNWYQSHIHLKHQRQQRRRTHGVVGRVHKMPPGDDDHCEYRIVHQLQTRRRIQWCHLGRYVWVLQCSHVHRLDPQRICANRLDATRRWVCSSLGNDSLDRDDTPCLTAVGLRLIVNVKCGIGAPIAIIPSMWLIITS